MAKVYVDEYVLRIGQISFDHVGSLFEKKRILPLFLICCNDENS